MGRIKHREALKDILDLPASVVAQIALESLAVDVLGPAPLLAQLGLILDFQMHELN